MTNPRTDRVDGLVAQTRELLLGFATELAETRWGPRLERASADLDAPLRIAVAGTVSAGKSTLINALTGARLAATDAGECTRVVTVFSYGPAARAWAIPRRADGGGSGEQLDLRYEPGRLEIDLGSRTSAEIIRVHVQVPDPGLVGMTVIDTPGLGSITSAGDATVAYLTADDLDPDGAPDAVLYVMRRLHPGDVSFLEAFRDPRAGAVPAVNAIGVLSRCDEIGGGRDDALDLGRELAARLADDARLRPLVQTVLPIAGLLAEAVATLDDEDRAALDTLAARPEAVTGELLLSAERFTGRTRAVDVPPAVRARLAGRLGMVGVRWALQSLREGEPLTDALLRRSGLDVLRDVLRRQLAQRRAVLKADGALRLAQEAAADVGGPTGVRIRRAVERLRVNTHEFEELDLLGRLRKGSDWDAETTTRLERVLGASGPSSTDRLCLPAGADDAEVRARARDEHRFWQELAGAGWGTAAQSRDAGVAQHTCEAILADVRP